MALEHHLLDSHTFNYRVKRRLIYASPMDTVDTVEVDSPTEESRPVTPDEFIVCA